MSGVFRCRNCQSLDVPMNGREQPEGWHKCIFGVAVGKYHQWEELTNTEWQKVRETAAQKRKQNERQTN